MLSRRLPLIASPPRRRMREPVVPMINVVFLLLIFFLMTAQIAPQAPFDMTLPRALGDEALTAVPLFVSRDGDLAYGPLRGTEALAAAAADAPLTIEADARLEAAQLARLLAELGRLGAADIQLATVRP
ncbi:biopolymer transporter ExbD [Aestuariicoccus sp. MJ-SS9]|uniref:ExbD/TolR family protein n=1 Tax=Aestuariicoccus sp. MJ-SS9 TaxID=3079855 RepID=UPI002914573F|nr:biopolymer transporter ExbD [Aestuariicoccus sp. MJ-SS9]MDU8913696.1 biopolymer transporter ExbD [Aestuariicoccus sp. MJ-SS9]